MSSFGKNIRKASKLLYIQLICLALGASLAAEPEIKIDPITGKMTVIVDGKEYKPKKISREEGSVFKRRLAIADLGEHWSGLDRYELLLALEAGEDREAEALITTAVASSDIPNGLYLILLELNSTNIFNPYSKELRKITRRIADEEPRGLLKKEDRQAVELLRYQLFHDVLKDKAMEAQCLANILGESKTRKLNKLTKMEEVTLDLTAPERLAASMLFKKKHKEKLREKRRTKEKRKRSDEIPVAAPAPANFTEEFPTNPVDSSKAGGGE